MIPCNECIVLAACKNRTSVDCDKLYDWVRKAKHQQQMMKEIKTLFSDVNMVYLSSSCNTKSVIFIRYIK